MNDEITTGDEGQSVDLSATPTDVPVETGMSTDVPVELPPQPYVLGEYERFVHDAEGRKLIEVKNIYTGCTYHKTDEQGNLLGINADGCLIKL